MTGCETAGLYVRMFAVSCKLTMLVAVDSGDFQIRSSTSSPRDLFSMLGLELSGLQLAPLDGSIDLGRISGSPYALDAELERARHSVRQPNPYRPHLAP